MSSTSTTPNSPSASESESHRDSGEPTSPTLLRGSFEAAELKLLADLMLVSSPLMLEAIQVIHGSMRLFEMYAIGHRAKNDTEKAVRNEQAAKACREFLRKVIAPPTKTSSG